MSFERYDVSGMSLEERVKRLEDREAIKELRAWYSYYVDRQDYDNWVDLFTEDAHIDFGHVGTFDGSEGVREFGEAFVGKHHSFAVHMIHNMSITVGGNTAKGKWYLEAPVVYRNGKAGWVQGIYNDEYHRVDGEWLFSEVVTEFNYVAYHDEGWGEISEDEAGSVVV